MAILKKEKKFQTLAIGYCCEENCVLESSPPSVELLAFSSRHILLLLLARGPVTALH